MRNQIGNRVVFGSLDKATGEFISHPTLSIQLGFRENNSFLNTNILTADSVGLLSESDKLNYSGILKKASSISVFLKKSEEARIKDVIQTVKKFASALGIGGEISSTPTERGFRVGNVVATNLGSEKDLEGLLNILS